MAHAVNDTLQTLLHKEAIRELLYRYCRAVDRCDWKLLRSCYLEDSFDDHGPVARCTGPEFVEVLKRRVSGSNRIMSEHVVSNILIELDGDRARTECYFRTTIANDGESLQLSGGRYIDLVELHAGDWYFKQRITVREWNLVTDSDAADNVRTASDGWFQGRHDRDDVAYATDLPRRPRHLPLEG